VTPGQTTRPLIYERRRLQRVGEPDTKMEHLLSTAKTGLLGDRKPSVSKVILRRDHPHPTLPHQGGGPPLATHIELPKEIVIAIERHHNSQLRGAAGQGS
jgi:hypothetical protein